DLGTAGVAVSVAIATGGGTLTGTTTRTTDASGRAEFTDLAINGDPGARTLVFSASGYGTVTSSSIDVQAAPAPPPTLGLSIVQQPGPGTLGTPLTPAPAVELLSDGEPAAGIVVTATLASGGGTLDGTTTATTGADGRAVFPNLVVNGDPGARTLRLAAGDFGSVESGAFDMQSPAPGT
ncbi:MAG TPA: hypothetical protein VMY76_17155, partial [Gemmatimonadales bacterium]|nr:hypothetical protein [Gemmatimonadales bacterium]